MEYHMWALNELKNILFILTFKLNGQATVGCKVWQRTWWIECLSDYLIVFKVLMRVAKIL